MPTRQFAHFFTFVFFCIFIGCFPRTLFTYTTDISENLKLWHGYAYGQVWELRHDVFIESHRRHGFVIAAPLELTKGIHTLIYDAPSTIEEYNKLYNNWPEVIGIVKKRTRIRCVRLNKYTAIQLSGISTSIYIYAQILDGHFSGKEVEISDMSLWERVDGKILEKPNLNLLNKV